MKKLRLFKGCVLSLLLSVVFFACSDEEPVVEEPEPVPTLIGYWELKNVEISNGGPGLNGYYNPFIFNLLSLEYQFFEGDEFVQYINVISGESGQIAGNYSINSDTTELELEFVSANDEEYELELDFNEMLLTRPEAFDVDDDSNPDTPPVQVSADVTYRYIKLY
mgnify:CR=1 FL=1